MGDEGGPETGGNLVRKRRVCFLLKRPGEELATRPKLKTMRSMNVDSPRGGEGQDIDGVHGKSPTLNAEGKLLS